MDPLWEYLLVGAIVFVAAVAFIGFKIRGHRRRKNALDSCSGMCENCPEHGPSCSETKKDD